MAAAGRMKEGGAETVDLLERIADDEAFGLNADELRDLVDPHRFVGRAPEQVALFLDTAVAPVLDRLTAEAQQLQEPDLHV
jgi:adenylosuccinate lyase